MSPSLAGILFAFACSGAPRSAPDPGSPPELERSVEPNQLPVQLTTPVRIAEGNSVAIDVRDIDLVARGVVLHVDYLTARLEPAGDYVDLEVPASFGVRLDAALLRFEEQSLRAVMGGAAALRDLEVQTTAGALELKGHAGALRLPFLFLARPRLREDGMIAIDLEKVRLLGIGIRGFLAAFDKPIEDAAEARLAWVHLDKDELVLDPFPFVGPPRVRAEFTAVEVQESALVARIGGDPGPSAERSGVVIHGGVLRMGGSMFFDTTIEIVAENGGHLAIDPDRLDAQIDGGWQKLRGRERHLTLHLAPAAGGA